MGTIHALLTRGQNKGTNDSPGTPEYHYKKGGKVAKKGIDFWSERTIDKYSQRRENSGKISNITSRYPIKATIAHTRIQKESNFASLEGWNSHSRL